MDTTQIKSKAVWMLFLAQDVSSRSPAIAYFSKCPIQSIETSLDEIHIFSLIKLNDLNKLFDMIYLNNLFDMIYLTNGFNVFFGGQYPYFC